MAVTAGHSKQIAPLAPGGITAEDDEPRLIPSVLRQLQRRPVQCGSQREFDRVAERRAILDRFSPQSLGLRLQSRNSGAIPDPGFSSIVRRPQPKPYFRVRTSADSELEHEPWLLSSTSDRRPASRHRHPGAAVAMTPLDTELAIPFAELRSPVADHARHRLVANAVVRLHRSWGSKGVVRTSAPALPDHAYCSRPVLATASCGERHSGAPACRRSHATMGTVALLA